MRRSSLLWMAFLALAAGLHADAAAGKADFLLGQKYQAAKQWGPAAKADLQTFKDDHQAYWAYKALGTVYYQAGDKRGALAYYDRYLAINPKDTATKAFANSLREQQGGAAPALANSPAAVQRDHGGFSVRLDLGGVMNDGADVASLYSASSPGGFATGLGFALDYALEGGFVGGVDFIYGPSRSYDVSIIGMSETDHWAINNMVFGVSPGWRFKLAQHWMIEPRVMLGYMLDSTTVSSSAGGPSDDLSASGLAIWPQVRGEYVFGKWGVGGSLGYLMANLSPVTDKTAGESVPDPSGSGNWVMKNGGVSFALYGAYHFNPPF